MCFLFYATTFFAIEKCCLYTCQICMLIYSSIVLFVFLPLNRFSDYLLDLVGFGMTSVFDMTADCTEAYTPPHAGGVKVSTLIRTCL